MSRSEFPNPLMSLLAVDATVVGGILFAVYGHSEVAVSVGAAGIALAGLATAGGVVYLAQRREPAVAAVDGTNEAIEALRRENAENLRLLQEDLHNLGQAVLKRLPQKGDAVEPVAATVSALAATLSAASADVVEVKSTVYEMQAQLDQLNDALLRSSATRPVTTRPVDDEAGQPVAPAGFGRALAAGATGTAISRLIANGASAKGVSANECAVASTDIEEAHPEGEPSPVSGGDLATTDQAPGSEPVASEPDAEWDDAEFAGVDESEPALAAFAPEGTDSETESKLTEQEDADWITGGFADPEEPAAAGGELPPARQPELLSLDDAPAMRKPRRPAKGETALIAHMMIGIGNKPYLRGIGPGLSTEAGVPMEYVDVGTWQWICPESDAPVAISVWKNDELPAEGDLIEIEPGELVEIHPKFDPQH